MSVLLKTISAMEKCFMDESFYKKSGLNSGSALLGEEFAFEAVYTSPDVPKTVCVLSVESPLAEYITVRQIEQVPVRYPAYPHSDDCFLRKTPGLYPDLLRPIDPVYKQNENDVGSLSVIMGELKSLYVVVKLPESLAMGDGVRSRDYPITLNLRWGENSVSATFMLHVIAAKLPPQKILVTNWFHADCIANYYDVGIFSERHWEYIEKFMRTAVENGINTILTPVFTPPLDTLVGGERPTVQLVDVYKARDGWRFGFARFERWVETAHRVGVTHFEISHLYTQWGASHAPKVVGYVGEDENGELQKLFGWETDAFSAEYCGFLREFLCALVEELKRLGIEKNVLFHISDEPSLEHLENYRRAKEQIGDILAGFKVIDALSDFEFYKTGVVENPIPANNHIQPFIDAGVADLWTYYCCGQTVKVSNRMIAMSMQRTRIIGVQFWKYRIAGFLQWGYNFYNSQYSTRAIDPYLITDGDYFVPAGDAFQVYPGEGGEAYETLHLKAFTMALSDMRALELLEEMVGRGGVEGLLDSALCGEEMRFDEYPREEGWLEAFREKVNAAIEERI